MNQSVIKALNLLNLFDEKNYELSLKDIANRANLPKPTAYRLLSALEAMNYVYKIKENEHDSRYRLGLKLLELGQLVSDQLEVRRIAYPYMEKLAYDIQEAVHLVVLNHQEATYIEKVESNKAIRLYTRIGKSSPLYIGSGPKLLLAHIQKQKQEEILNLAGNTINREKMEKELRHIRTEGYSYSIGEQDENTTGISYPIYDYRNNVIAALTVSGLSTYFEGDSLQQIKAKTEDTAARISRKLGFRGFVQGVVDSS
ncbi:IclR family transcriptional regulator [Ornithinibacillus massiliensis]|uniref:IclR family transcriptional regulator n=1 Tax=Ornithinibacillus massiliensis TaxID=1944633 RepID=A0ABS5MGL9_9BACI|nr:IclR family transcriptional regulator [Ornithinibacillus massiliensis]MBS3681017.1 IclR family transcriptional regulator [Ornithinibacillus massiliensis]